MLALRLAHHPTRPKAHPALMPLVLEPVVAVALGLLNASVRSRIRGCSQRLFPESWGAHSRRSTDLLSLIWLCRRFAKMPQSLFLRTFYILQNSLLIFYYFST